MTQLLDFHAAIRGETTIADPPDAETGLPATRIALAAIESARSEQSVRLQSATNKPASDQLPTCVALRAAG